CTYTLDTLSYRAEHATRDPTQRPHISNPIGIADNLKLARQFSGPTASRLVQSTFQSSHHFGAERYLCTRSQDVKFCSTQIALLLGYQLAAERRTCGSNRSDLAQTQCQPTRQLAQPPPTISTP